MHVPTAATHGSEGVIVFVACLYPLTSLEARLYGNGTTPHAEATGRLVSRDLYWPQILNYLASCIKVERYTGTKLTTY